MNPSEAPPIKRLHSARFVRTLARDMRKKPTNLTISDEIRHRAQHIMNRRGFSSFSAFVEQLIREAWDAQTAPRAASPGLDPVAQHLAAILNAGRVEALRETPAPGAPPVQAAPANYATAAPTIQRTPRKPKTKPAKA